MSITTHSNSEGYGLLLGFIAVAAFALTLPITRALTASLSIWDIGLGRGVLASVFAGIILVATRQKWPNSKQLLKLSIVASGVAFGFPVLTAIGMKTVPASHGGIILGGLPLATAIFGRFLSKERPSFGFWVLAVLGFTVIALFVFLTEGIGNIQVYLGDFALLGAVVMGGLGYAQGGVLARDLGGWQVICWTLIVSLPFLIPTAIFLVRPENFIALPETGWAIFIFLSLVNTLTGFFLFYKGMAIAGVARVSQIQLLQPFLTLLFAVFFLGEPFTLLIFLFTATIVGVVFLSKQMEIVRS